MSSGKDQDIEGFDHATEEDYFEEELKRRDIYEYCQYLTFKFVCYLDAYCMTRIKEMTVEYAWEDTDLVYLVNAFKIQFFNLSYVNDYMLKEIDVVNEELRNAALSKIKASPYQGKIEQMYAFREFLNERYQEIKKNLGVQKDFEESVLENPASNEAFKMLNPDASFTLYDVITNEEEFEKFKVWLIKKAESSGDKSNFYKSALRSAQTILEFESKLAKKAPKLNQIQKKSQPELPREKSNKAFMKKIKVLDICGNGYSRKKIISSAEAMYHTGILASKRFQEISALKSPSRPTTANRTKMNLDLTNQTADSQKLAILRPTSATNKCFNLLPNRMLFNKTNSLTSLLYTKPAQ